MEECASYLKPTSAFKSHEKEGKEILNKVRQENVRAAGRPSFGFPRQVDHYDTVYVLSPNEHHKEELRTSGLKFGRESPKDIFSVTKDPSSEDLSTPRRPTVVGSQHMTSESAQKRNDSGTMQATRPTTAPAANATRATMIRKELFREPNSFSSIASPQKEPAPAAGIDSPADVGAKKAEESHSSSILPAVKQEMQSPKPTPAPDSVRIERSSRPTTAPSPVKQKTREVSLPKVAVAASQTKVVESIASSASATSPSLTAASSGTNEDQKQSTPKLGSSIESNEKAVLEATNDAGKQKQILNGKESTSFEVLTDETTRVDSSVSDDQPTAHHEGANADLGGDSVPVDLHGAEEKVEDIKGEIAEISEIIAALNRDLVANVTSAAMASFHIPTIPSDESPTDETTTSPAKMNASQSVPAQQDVETSVVQWDPREVVQRIESCIKDTVACAVDDAQLAVLALKQRKRELAAQAVSESKKSLHAEQASRPQPQIPIGERSLTPTATNEAAAAELPSAVIVGENSHPSLQPLENDELPSDSLGRNESEPIKLKETPIAITVAAVAPAAVTVASETPIGTPIGTVFDSFLSHYAQPLTETAAAVSVEASAPSDGSPERRKTKKSKTKAKAKEKKKRTPETAPRSPQDYFSDDSSDEDRGSGREEDYDGDGDIAHGNGRGDRVGGQRGTAAPRKKASTVCACDICAMLKREKLVLKNMYMTWREVRRMHRATRRGAPPRSLNADDGSDALPLPPDQLLGLCLSEMVKFSAESHRLLQSCQRSFLGPKASGQHPPFQCDKVSMEAPVPTDA